MRLGTTIRTIAFCSASTLGLWAGGASAGARTPLIIPGIGPDRPVPPYVRGNERPLGYAARPAYHAHRRAPRHARLDDGAFLYGEPPYAPGAGPYDHSYRPTAYNAADAYPPPAPRVYGYIFPPASEPSYSEAYWKDAWIGVGSR